MKLTNEDRHENMSQDTSPPAGNENASQDPSPPASGANENASQDPPPPSTANENASQDRSLRSTAANENGSDGSSGSSPPSGTESENGSQDSPDSPHPSDTDTESEEDEIEGFIAVALASRRGDVSDEEDDLPDPVEVETGMSVLDGSDRKVATGDLIQICGPSLIGKTQLLYALVASAIAPAPAGRGGHVRYFELNESIDAKRMKMLVANLCKDALDCSERELKKHARKAMKRLVIYRANSTVQLCITLKSLLPFLETRAGQKVDMIAIDALGTHHFIDEFEGSPKHGTTAKILLGVLEEILHSRKVFVAVTECAMLDDQPLPLPAGHGLSEEQVPCKPGDLMPNGWIDIVTHCIVLYLSAQNESESFFAEESEPNGAIVLRYADSGPRALVMMAAGALKIEKASVTIAQQDVLAASELQEEEEE